MTYPSGTAAALAARGYWDFHAEIVPGGELIRAWGHHEPMPEITQKEAQGAMVNAAARKIQRQIFHRLNAGASLLYFDSIHSMAQRRTDADQQTAALGQAAYNWMRDTENTARAILMQVKAGARAIPNDITDIEAELPPRPWNEQGALVA